MKHFRSLLVAAVACLTITAPLQAQERSSQMKGLALSNDKPIQIESDQLEIREQEKKAIFDGNVKVAQGAMTIRSSHMIVYYKGDTGSVASGGGDIDRIEVSGKVLIASGTQKATAETGSFNMATEILVLEGKQVVLSENNNVFTGCKLTVRMKTGQAQVEGCKKGATGNGRVIMSLTPSSANKQP